MTHTFAAAPARSRTLPRAPRAPHSKLPLSSRFSEKVQITDVSHMTEDGVDPRFLQEISGHRFASTTGIYTHLSGEFMNKMLLDALERIKSMGEAEG
jgi:integrase